MNAPLALLLAGAVLVTAPPSTQQLLALARGWVAEYERELPQLVADERLDQSAWRDTWLARSAPGPGPRRRPPAGPDEVSSTRVLESQFAWVRLTRIGETVGLRDVLRVDGVAVADSGTLQQLLEAPPADPDREIRDLLAASERHTLAGAARNFNFPTFPFVYLHPRRAETLSWKSARVSDGRWELRFTEHERRTVVRTPTGGPVRAKGVFRFDSASARLDRAEIWLDGRTRADHDATGREVRFTYRMVVTFALDQRLGLWLPATMEDEYVAEPGHAHQALPFDAPGLVVAGRAAYSNYRRFDTRARLRP